MIYAIGHDIVENKRIARMLEQYGQKFVEKILSPTEQLIHAQRQNKVNFIAKRFAAKEAFAKACGTGLRDPILMPGISIVNNAAGKPLFKFNTAIQAWLSQHGISNC